MHLLFCCKSVIRRRAFRVGGRGQVNWTAERQSFYANGNGPRMAKEGQKKEVWGRRKWEKHVTPKYVAQSNEEKYLKDTHRHEYPYLLAAKWDAY